MLIEMALPLAEIPTVSQLYKSCRLVPTSAPALQPSTRLNNTIALIRHDITKLRDIECIVNAADNSLLGGGGVDGAIHAGAGLQLVRECSKLGGCDTGDAKMTQAYDLPYRSVIHTVGPVYMREYSKNPSRPEELLRSCYRRSLELAVASQARSIAFPAISTGVYGYPKGKAARIALDEVRSFLEGPDGVYGSNTGLLEKVVFCNFGLEDEMAYEEVIPYSLAPCYGSCI